MNWASLRAATAYGRFPYLRDVTGQPFGAPRALDSSSVTRRDCGAAGESRWSRCEPALGTQLLQSKYVGLSIGTGNDQLGAADTKPLRINKQAKVQGLLHGLVC